MKLRATTIYADAWSLWRADWHILTAVAGMFVFLPQLALALLVPDFPDMSSVTSADPNDASFRAWEAGMQVWIASYGPWYIAALLAALFGQFALVAIYVAPRNATVGGAMLTALQLLPRLMLASVIWMLPMGLVGMLLMRVAFLMLPVFALVMARMLLVAPAIVAARPMGAVAAIGRSVRTTRGNMLVLASIVLAVVLAQYLLQIPFLMVDQWLVKNSPNPVARLIVDTVVSAIGALAATAMALAQVAAWRRLSSS